MSSFILLNWATQVHGYGWRNFSSKPSGFSGQPRQIVIGSFDVIPGGLTGERLGFLDIAARRRGVNRLRTAKLLQTSVPEFLCATSPVAAIK